MTLWAALPVAAHAGLIPVPSPPLPTPVLPSVAPAAPPSVLPTALPSVLPTALPSAQPTALPQVLPTALPSLLPTALPPTPPVGPPVAAPSASPSAAPGGGGAPPPGPPAGAVSGAGAGGGGDRGGGGLAPQPSAGDAPARSTSQVPQGALSPLLIVPAGPAGQALAFGLALLPILIAIWLLVAVKIWAAAEVWRSSRLRLLVAADLGIRPMELAAMTPEHLQMVHGEVALDDLTGVLRRAAGVEALHREMARARRRRRPLAAGFIDCDGLKRINDSEGHAAGDALIRDVAELLRGRLRGEDVVFRYGGDEFVCVLPEADLARAGSVFEEIAAAARQRGRSISYGLAELRPGDDAVAFLGRADGELSRGRQARRRQGEQVTWREGPRREIAL